MNNKKNYISAIVYQAAAIIQGLIIPRLIIATFGSDVNGLVSSLTQFLSFISLLEGGLGAVVLAELYSPIENNDIIKVQSILYSCQKLFRRLAIIYVVYTLLLAITYPLFTNESFSFAYISSLTIILSITTLGQYLFAISNKLLLQARQKIYIVNFVSAATIILNLLITVLIIYVYPRIHIIKLCAGLIFLIQPLIYRSVVEKKYVDRSNLKDRNYKLENRWSGFAQNLAYFINVNTDIVVTTVFLGLNNVSVYSIYMLAINALRQVISNAAISYQSALGRYYALGDKENLVKKFSRFEISFWGISILLYCVCLHLINGFVGIYTTGVNDANYYQPLFALIMTLANMFYCIREPYRIMVLSAGKFKETNFGAFLEAALNLTISLILVSRFGLTGIAIGTFIAIIYRLIYFLGFLRKTILNLSTAHYVKLIIELGIVLVVNIFLYFYLTLKIESFLSFILYGMVFVVGEGLLIAIVYFCVEWIVKVLTKTS